MLCKENFTKEHIVAFRADSKRDPGVLERTVFAFGLLEALARSGLPFVFKGGTCLILLLEKPCRLSTDIDIIVAPGVNIEPYVTAAAKIFPFIKQEEDLRVSSNHIEKRHFKFSYCSPISGKDVYILLDVVFAESPYAKTITKEIRGDFLLTEPEYVSVCVPSAACMLGDKFTAFAPHTIGILLHGKKDMEVMKQFYDIATLLEIVDDFEEVRTTYHRVAAIQRDYRGLHDQNEAFLADTFCAALCIASQDKFAPMDCAAYKKAINSLRHHIYTTSYNVEIATGDAVKIAYAAVCLLTGIPFERVSNDEGVQAHKFKHKFLKIVGYLRKTNLQAFAYAVQMDRLLDRALEIYPRFLEGMSIK